MYKTYRFLIMTTDPVHIGTGGMRLGRVDNTIVREPGTRLPKIPGTALHGAIRAYAARRYGKPQCAGQGSTEGKKHCGRPTCPICYTFGSLQGEAGSFAGVVSISDARILLFPVYSMVGPVWVTSPSVLEDVGCEGESVNQNKAKWPNSLSKHDSFNLGWLMVERDGNNWQVPNNLRDKLLEPIGGRIVLVSDRLFSQVVNSNLEVRTSVAINPETGAAEEGALYTYEAIPRATLLWFDVVEDDFRGNFPTVQILTELQRVLNNRDEDKKKNLLRKWNLYSDQNGKEKLEENVNKIKRWIEDEKFKENNDEKWKWEKIGCKGNEESILCIIQAGLEWAEHLGIGGMGTKGFGRIKKVVDPWEV